MKQINIKELKEICGCRTNNDFANFVSLLLGTFANECKNEGSKVSIDYGEIQEKRSHRIYSKLQELGYYEGV